VAEVALALDKLAQEGGLTPPTMLQK